MATWGIRGALAVVLLALVTLLTPDTARADGCTPGQQTGCMCAGGKQGFQVCDDDGKRYGPCECAEQETAEAAEAEVEREAAEQSAGGSTNGGIVRVHSTAPGTVYVNQGAKWIEKWGQVGRVDGEPLDIEGLPLGPHGIKIEFDFGDSEEDGVTVTQGTVSEVRFNPEIPTTEMNSPAMLGVGIGSIVLGLSGAGIGTGLLISYYGEEEQFRIGDEGKETAGAALLGVGAAVFAAGVVLTVVGAWQVPIEAEGSEAAIIVEPLIGPTGGGLRVRF